MVQYLNRDDFLDQYWDYRRGEHVSFIEPTQGGKTYLMWQIIEATQKQHPDLRIVSLMPKPKDPATNYWKQRTEFKEIQEWPPPMKMFWQDPPKGYVLWPRHNPRDEKANRDHLSSEFKKCMNDLYWHGDSIVMADDVYLHATLYDLNQELERHWTAGAGGGAALFSANQKPSGSKSGGSVSSFSYNAPTHLFLGRDRDERNIERFGEIGGVDPKAVQEIVRGLRIHRIGDHSVSEKLYIDKRGPYLAVIGP